MKKQLWQFLMLFFLGGKDRVSDDEATGKILLRKLASAADNQIN